MLPAHSKVRVKICGLTNEADTCAAIACGADALGFNTWRGGKRFLDLQAASWLARLPVFVTKVALLVNATLEEAAAIARLPFIDALQLHGDESPAYTAEIARLGRPFIKVLRVSSPDDLTGLERYGTRLFLLDAHVPGQYGGTGARADLALVQEFAQRYPDYELILAGGLLPENVAAAVAAVRPSAVDVSSGVESSPGHKDHERMRAFVTAVRAASEAQ